MAVELVFRLDSGRLGIEDKKTGEKVEFPNRVVVNQARGLILSLGEDEEVARSRLAGRFGQDEMATLSLFGVEGTHLTYELRVLAHLRRLLARQSGNAGRGSLLPGKPGKGSDYILEIPGYELFPLARRREFEHAIQAYFRVRRLLINGEDRAIPAARRELEIQVRRLFVRAVPGAAAIVGYLAAPASLRADRLALLAYVLLILVLVYYGGRVGWMVLARRIVPVEYCLYMLQNARGRRSTVDRWLARTLWGRSAPG